MAYRYEWEEEDFYSANDTGYSSAYPYDMDSIKRVYCFLNGTERRFQKFWKTARAKYDAGDYRVVSGYHLYDGEKLFQAFQADAIFNGIMEHRKIKSWEELVYRADEMFERPSFKIRIDALDGWKLYYV